MSGIVVLPPINSADLGESCLELSEIKLVLWPIFNQNRDAPRCTLEPVAREEARKLWHGDHAVGVGVGLDKHRAQQIDEHVTLVPDYGERLLLANELARFDCAGKPPLRHQRHYVLTLH